MKVVDYSILTKKYVKTLLIENGELHYLPFLIEVDNKNKSFNNYKNVINKDDIKDYLTDKMIKFLEASNTVLLKNSYGFIPYNIDKNILLEYKKLHNLINK